jgi:hypothetical protein
MMKKLFIVLCALVFGLGLAANAFATLDSELMPYLQVKFDDPKLQDKWEKKIEKVLFKKDKLGKDEVWKLDKFLFKEDGLEITIDELIVNNDPYIKYAFGFTNQTGADLNIGFSVSAAIAPPVPGGSSSVVTNGIGAGWATTDGSITITPLNPPPGIPVDGDGVAEFQVFSLSSDGGMTFVNTGIDVGPLFSANPGPFQAGNIPSDNQGPVASPAGGPWNWMRLDVNFTLSDGETFSPSGIASINVPEPATMLLIGTALLGLAGFTRRFRKK